MGNNESHHNSSYQRDQVKAKGGGEGDRDHHAWSDEESGIKGNGQWTGAESGFNENGRNMKSVRSHPDEAFGVSTPQRHQEGQDGAGEKKGGLTSGLRRLMSGKKKRGGGNPELPQSVQDLKAHGGGDGAGSGAGPVASRGKFKRIKGMNLRQQRLSASAGVAGSPSKDDIKQMSVYLCIDLKTKEGKALKWIAEEALAAPLPQGWEEHRTDEGVCYYHHNATGQSIWEHPMDAYFHFLLGKMRKMRRANKGLPSRDSIAQRAKNRELIDLLWAMEMEQRQEGGGVGEGSQEGTSDPDTSSTFGSSSRQDSQSETPSLYSSSDASPCSSRLSSVTPLLDLESVPDEVREMANSLGINLEALNTPVSIEEVREMAEYLGIDVMREGYLLPLVKIALQAPLPKGWQVYKDDKGDPFYSHRKSGRTSYRHPADEYFMKKVLEDRTRHIKAVQEGSAVRASEPWLDFVDDQQERYWYNFRSGEKSSVRPALYSVLDRGSSRGTTRTGTPAGGTPTSARGQGMEGLPTSVARSLLLEPQAATLAQDDS